MSEKLTLLENSTAVKAQTIATYLESSGIACYLQNTNLYQTKDEAITNIFVKETDYEKAFNLLNSFHPEVVSRESPLPDQQAFPGLFIIPVDFSLASEKACYYAIELAAKFKARIKLIHTYGIPDLRPFAMEEGDIYQNTLNNQFIEEKEQLEGKMSELEQKLKNYISSRSLAEVPVTRIMVNGLPDEITLYSAETDQASLIVLGISGENAMSFGTAGKIASRIIEKSSIPVLIIPEENQFTILEKIKNILYLTTFDESDFSAIQKLISTIKNIRLNIFCLHIEKSGTVNPWDRIKMNGLKEYFKNSYNLNNVVCDLVTSDNMIQTLDEFIEKNKIEIITIINHKQNVLSKLLSPGIAKKILFHTQIPLLVFHD